MSEEDGDNMDCKKGSEMVGTERAKEDTGPGAAVAPLVSECFSQCKVQQVPQCCDNMKEIPHVGDTVLPCERLSQMECEQQNTTSETLPVTENYLELISSRPFAEQEKEILVSAEKCTGPEPKEEFITENRICKHEAYPSGPEVKTEVPVLCSVLDHKNETAINFGQTTMIFPDIIMEDTSESEILPSFYRSEFTKTCIQSLGSDKDTVFEEKKMRTRRTDTNLEWVQKDLMVRPPELPENEKTTINNTVSLQEIVKGNEITCAKEMDTVQNLLDIDTTVSTKRTDQSSVFLGSESLKIEPKNSEESSQEITPPSESFSEHPLSLCSAIKKNVDLPESILEHNRDAQRNIPACTGAQETTGGDVRRKVGRSSKKKTGKESLEFESGCPSTHPKTCTEIKETKEVAASPIETALRRYSRTCKVASHLFVDKVDNSVALGHVSNLTHRNFRLKGMKFSPAKNLLASSQGQEESVECEMHSEAEQKLLRQGSQKKKVKREKTNDNGMFEEGALEKSSRHSLLPVHRSPALQVTKHVQVPKDGNGISTSSLAVSSLMTSVKAKSDQCVPGPKISDLLMKLKRKRGRPYKKKTLMKLKKDLELAKEQASNFVQRGGVNVPTDALFSHSEMNIKKECEDVELYPPRSLSVATTEKGYKRPSSVTALMQQDDNEKCSTSLTNEINLSNTNMEIKIKEENYETATSEQCNEGLKVNKLVKVKKKIGRPCKKRTLMKMKKDLSVGIGQKSVSTELTAGSQSNMVSLPGLLPPSLQKVKKEKRKVVLCCTEYNVRQYNRACKTASSFPPFKIEKHCEPTIQPSAHTSSDPTNCIVTPDGTISTSPISVIQKTSCRRGRPPKTKKPIEESDYQDTTNSRKQNCVAPQVCQKDIKFEVVTVTKKTAFSKEKNCTQKKRNIEQRKVNEDTGVTSRTQVPVHNAPSQDKHLHVSEEQASGPRTGTEATQHSSCSSACESHIRSQNRNIANIDLVENMQKISRVSSENLKQQTLNKNHCKEKGVTKDYSVNKTNDNITKKIPLSDSRSVQQQSHKKHCSRFMACKNKESVGEITEASKDKFMQCTLLYSGQSKPSEIPLKIKRKVGRPCKKKRITTKIESVSTGFISDTQKNPEVLPPYHQKVKKKKIQKVWHPVVTPLRRYTRACKMNVNYIFCAGKMESASPYRFQQTFSTNFSNSTDNCVTLGNDSSHPVISNLVEKLEICTDQRIPEQHLSDVSKEALPNLTCSVYTKHGTRKGTCQMQKKQGYEGLVENVCNPSATPHFSESTVSGKPKHLQRHSIKRKLCPNDLQDTTEKTVNTVSLVDSEMAASHQQVLQCNDVDLVRSSKRKCKQRRPGKEAWRQPKIMPSDKNSVVGPSLLSRKQETLSETAVGKETQEESDSVCQLSVKSPASSELFSCAPEDHHGPYTEINSLEAENSNSSEETGKGKSGSISQDTRKPEQKSKEVDQVVKMSQELDAPQISVTDEGSLSKINVGSGILQISQSSSPKGKNTAATLQEDDLTSSKMQKETEDSVSDPNKGDVCAVHPSADEMSVCTNCPKNNLLSLNKMENKKEDNPILYKEVPGSTQNISEPPNFYAVSFQDLVSKPVVSQEQQQKIKGELEDINKCSEVTSNEHNQNAQEDLTKKVKRPSHLPALSVLHRFCRYPAKTRKSHVQCRFCGQFFRHITTFAVHLRIHTGEKPYRCRDCGKTFLQLSNLNAHRRVHKQSGHMQCPYCKCKFSNREKLLTHFYTHVQSHRSQIVDTDTEGAKTVLPTSGSAAALNLSKPFLCLLCNKAFQHSTVLKHHMRIHKTLKAFFCKICGKAFHQTSALSVHERNHWPVKPYACSICGKGFSQCRALKSHTQTHTGEKPFSCASCGNAYAELSFLRKHQASKVCLGGRQEGEAQESNSDALLMFLGLDEQPKPLAAVCQPCGDSRTPQCDHSLNSAQSNTVQPEPEPEPELRKNCSEQNFSVLNEEVPVCAELAPARQTSHVFPDQLQPQSFGPSLSQEKQQQAVSGCEERDDDSHVATVCEPAKASENAELQPCSSLPDPREKELTLSESTTQKDAPLTDVPHMNLPTPGEDNVQRHFLKPTHKTLKRHLRRHKWLQLRSQRKHWWLKNVRQQKRGQFFCSECHRRFRFAGLYLDHLQEHTEQNPFLCLLCHSTFSDKDMLKAHQREKHMIGTNKCCYCGKGFSNVGNLKKHTHLHSGPRAALCCPHCNRSFSHTSNLQVHLKNFDKLEMFTPSEMPSESLLLPYQCKHCNSSFKTLDLLSLHEDSHPCKEVASVHRVTEQLSELQNYFTPAVSAPPERLFSTHVNQTRSLYDYPHPDSLYVCPISFACSFLQYSSSRKYPQSHQISTRLVTKRMSQPGFQNYAFSPVRAQAQVRRHVKCNGIAQTSRVKEYNVPKNFGNSMSCAECTARFSLISELFDHYLKHARGDV